MSEFFVQLFCDQNKVYSIIIEDDGKVAYAYLILAKEIIGDLWLYNNATAPEEINWKQQELPYLNPLTFLKEGIQIAPIVNRQELLCHWTMDSLGGEYREWGFY